MRCIRIKLLRGCLPPIWGGLIAALLLSPAAALADSKLSGADLVAALRAGGYKIYFRHAQTDWSNSDQVDSVGDWVSCDTTKMRQLSNHGRETAKAIGQAMRALKIPVGEVIASEYCRTKETAELLGLGPVQTTRDIINMRVDHFLGGTEAVVARARAVFRRTLPAGQNLVMVAHGNVMRAATGDYVDEAGAGIYALKPGSDLGFEAVAILSPKDWAALAAQFGN